MKHTLKKSLSLLMTFCMVVSLFAGLIGSAKAVGPSVTFDARNGQTNESKLIENVTELPAPTWTDSTGTAYTFAGWFTGIDGGGDAVTTLGAVQALTADTTLYAKWTHTVNGETKTVRTVALDVTNITTDKTYGTSEEKTTDTTYYINHDQGWKWDTKAVTLTLDNLTINTGDANALILPATNGGTTVTIPTKTDNFVISHYAGEETTCGILVSQIKENTGSTVYFDGAGQLDVMSGNSTGKSGCSYGLCALSGAYFRGPIATVKCGTVKGTQADGAVAAAYYKDSVYYNYNETYSTQTESINCGGYQKDSDGHYALGMGQWPASNVVPNRIGVYAAVRANYGDKSATIATDIRFVPASFENSKRVKTEYEHDIPYLENMGEIIPYQQDTAQKTFQFENCYVSGTPMVGKKILSLTKIVSSDAIGDFFTVEPTVNEGTDGKPQTITYTLKPSIKYSKTSSNNYEYFLAKIQDETEGTTYETVMPFGVWTELYAYVEPYQLKTTVGSVTESLPAVTEMALSPQTPVYTYQWYQCADKEGTGKTLISGATSAAYPLPADLKVGTYYYCCHVTLSNWQDYSEKEFTADSNVATVTVNPLNGNISGIVKQNGAPVKYATVKLIQGNETIDSTNTDSNGAYKFEQKLYGVYSIQVNNEDKIVTTSLVLSTPTAEKNVTIPDVTGNENTEVVMAADTPYTSADLNGLFTDTEATEETKGVTAQDKAVVSAGGTVDIKLSATKEETPADADKITKLANDSKANYLYVDLTVTKDVTPVSGNTTTTTLTELNNLVEVNMEVPEAYRSKTLRIFRVHDGTAEELKTTANKYGEYFKLNSDYSVATMYLKRFSTFCLSNAVTPASDLAVSAPSVYTLTFDTNGGSAISSVGKLSGETVDLAGYLPTKTGDTFAGWYSDAKLTTKVTSVKMQANTTIYAKWTAKTAVLPADLNSTDHIAYVSGYADGTVRPNANITRAETAEMLYRLLTAAKRSELQTAAGSFTDVRADAWYRAAADAVAKGGYITGYSDGTFQGSKQITRAEFIVMLTRFIPVQKGTANFTDVSTSFWGYENLSTAVACGWISGYADGSFKPDQYVTRAEAVAIINRVLNRGVGAEGVCTGTHTFPDNQTGAWYYYEMLEATNAHDYTGVRPDEHWTAIHA